MPEDFLVEAMTLMDMEGEYKDRANMRGKFYCKLQCEVLKLESPYIGCCACHALFFLLSLLIVPSVGCPNGHPYIITEVQQ